MIRSSCLAMVFCALLLTLIGGHAGAQTIFNEDFSTGMGLTPPAGWTTAGGAAQWRWDNPGGRGINPPMFPPAAICDSDFAGSGTTTLSTMFSPTFDASTAVQIVIEWDHFMMDLNSSIAVEVFDGATWNPVMTAGGADVGTEMNPQHEMFDITAAAGAATNAQVRFVYTAGWDWWWLVDNVHVYEPAMNDVEVLSIDTPTVIPEACLNTLGASETVSVTVRTNGSIPVTAGSLIQMDAEVDGVNVATEFFLPAATLNQDDTAPFTFATMMALGAPASELKVTASFFGDQDSSNDSQTLLLHQPVRPVGYRESFDSVTPDPLSFPISQDVPELWQNDPNDPASLAGNPQQGWAPRATNQSNGPSSDHTQNPAPFSTYMTIDDTSNDVGDMILISPCLDTLSALATPAVSFWHSSPAAAGSALDNVLEVDLIDETAGGTVTMSLATFPGNGTRDWVRQEIDLSAFFGNTVRIAFRANNNNGGDMDDVSIDDFTFYDSQPNNGQAPVPGQAYFDINGSALNPNSEPVAFLVGGPFFADITPGGTLQFEMSGEPLQPIILFAGPLNPAVANFPGVGTMDVGGPVDPMTGLPTLITLLADGTMLGGFNPFFILSATGETQVGFSVPNFPPGVLSTFQCAMLSSQSAGLALSNCIQVSVM